MRQLEKKVLFITDFLPPSTMGRAEKTKSRVECFLERGWSVDVLCTTTKNPIELDGTNLIKPPVFFPGLDCSARFARFLMLTFACLMLAIRILSFRRHEYQFVYTINNPVLFHLFGYLCKLKTGAMWMVEVRDSWLEFGERRSLRFLWLHRAIESIVCAHATRIFCHQGMRHSTSYWNKVSKGKIKELEVLPPLGGRNLLGTYQPLKSHEGVEKKSTFTIGYFGRFYPNEIEPNQFVSALHVVAGQAKTAVRVLFYGEDPRPYLKSDYSDLVSYEGSLAHEEALVKMKECDALLLLMGPSPGCEYAIPTKLFDYLSAQRPILGVVPSNAIAVRELLSPFESNKLLTGDEGLSFEIAKFIQSPTQTDCLTPPIERSVADNCAVDLFERELTSR